MTQNNGWGAGFYNNAIGYNSVTGAPLSSHGVNFNTFGSNHGVVEAINNETVGGIISKNSARYHSTSVSDNGPVNISNNGDSLTVRTFWQSGNFQDGRSQVPNTGGTNEVFQIGIVDSTAGVFGANSNYLYLAGIENAWTRAAGAFDFSNQTHDLEYQVISGAGTTIGSNTTVTGADLTHDRIGASTQTDRYWYEFNLTYTNNNGNLDIAIDVDQWKGGYQVGSSIFNPTLEVNSSFHNSSLSNVPHSLDLTSIRVGLGIHIDDPTTVASSGTTYDDFTTDPIPEPSTSLLSGLAALAMAMRRKRS